MGGKEKIGLNPSDYGARWYDAAIGRFGTIDRFTEKYPMMTGFQYGANNPIKYIDVNGDSLDLSQIQMIDKGKGTNYGQSIINYLNSQTGLSLSLDSKGQMQYAKDSNGNPVVSQTTDSKGNLIDVGSATARNGIVSAISNTSSILVRIAGSSSAAGTTASGQDFINLNVKQINGFINGTNNLDNRTQGWGMTLMHEIRHTVVGGGLKDASGFGNMGSVEPIMNTIRQELNAKGGNYGQRTSYEGITFSATGSPAYIPYDKASKSALNAGSPPSTKSKYIKF